MLELRVTDSLHDVPYVPFTSLELRLYGEPDVMNIDKKGMLLEVLLGALKVNFSAH